MDTEIVCLTDRCICCFNVNLRIRYDKIKYFFKTFNYEVGEIFILCHVTYKLEENLEKKTFEHG